MIKNKKFIANVHVSSIEREEKLPLWNTNTDSFIETHMTNNIFEIDAEDKHVQVPLESRVRHGSALRVDVEYVSLCVRPHCFLLAVAKPLPRAICSAAARTSSCRRQI